METSKPQPPILEFAIEFFKAHARTQAKIRKKSTETREEKLIPKPSSMANKDKKSSPKMDGHIFATNEDDEDSETEFKTKLDVDSEHSEPKQKKLKRKKSANNAEGSAAVKKTKKKKPNFQMKPAPNDAEDELIDFELSD
jgi:hypothetical protein